MVAADAAVTVVMPEPGAAFATAAGAGGAPAIVIV